MKNVEWKVGIFVVIGLTLLALLILNFSKGVTLGQSTYKLHVIMPTVGGLKPAADAMMAGVPIGKVLGEDLRDDGRSVDITVSILAKYKIRDDAQFTIDSIGFLGDQYVSVILPKTAPPAGQKFYKDGDVIQGVTGFDIQQALLSTAGLLDIAKKTLKDVDQAITNVNQTVLSSGTLNDFSLSLSNIEVVSEEAVTLVRGAQGVLNSNSAPVNVAITNLQEFAQKLNKMGDQLQKLVADNRPEVNAAIKNFRDVSATFKQLADDLRAGKGIAGTLLTDETMKLKFGNLITNVDAVAEDFATLGDNINRKGIWGGALWKPKQPPTNSIPGKGP